MTLPYIAVNARQVPLRWRVDLQQQNSVSTEGGSQGLCIRVISNSERMWKQKLCLNLESERDN